MTTDESHEKSHTRDELAYRLRQQVLVTDFGLFCLRAPSLPDLLHHASRATADGLESHFAKVLEPAPAEGDFRIVAGVGWHPDIIGTARVPGGSDSPAGYALQTNKPVTSNVLADEERFRTPKLLLDHNVKSAINVIIHGDRETFGILEVDSSHIGCFDEADTRFLQGFANLLGVAIERHRMRAELRSKEDLLRRALEHEKILVLEVHHRVKNSLALIAGLLTLQRRASANEELSRALEDAEARIFAVAQVHDHLATHGKGRQVPLRDFVEALCTRLSETRPGHELVLDIAPLSVSADRAVTLGLLINELVTNAFKYAYVEHGEVRVSVRDLDGQRFVLEISDDGVGMPDEPIHPAKGLGTKVITSLASQLGSRAVWHRGQQGTLVTLEFAAEPVTNSI